MIRKLYQHIASRLEAMRNCQTTGNGEWHVRHEAAVHALCDMLPHGSGFDAGTYLNFKSSTPERLVFTTSFHHMDENGSYVGWTDHTVVVTPSLAHGFDMKVTGRDRNDIKDYIADTFSHALHSDVDDAEVAAIANAAA